MRGRKKFHFSVSITCSLSTTLYFHLLQTERNGGGGQPNASRCVLNGSFSGAVMHKKQANGTQKNDRQLHGYSICQLVTKYDISQVPTKSCNNEDAWEQLLKMEKNVHFICLQFNRIYSQKEIAIWFCSDRVSKFEEKKDVDV